MFVCKAWPHSGHCSQAGYKPSVDTGVYSNAWKDAWTMAGYCLDSMVPAPSPSFDPATTIGKCPNQWIKGILTTYWEGDMVSAVMLTSPPRQMAYKCKEWSFSNYCGLFGPTEFGGEFT